MNAKEQPESGNQSSTDDSKASAYHSPTRADLSSGDIPSPNEQAHRSVSVPPTVGVGSTLGPYELLEKVGQGGMGAVYKARQTRLKKIVAVKVLAASSIGNDQAQARFDREMEAVGKIDHPNIVRALDAGEFGGIHYLSMEYVDGTDLSKLVKERGPLSPLNACKVILQAAQGLAVAHAAGLVHRDIKPANMLLTKDGRVKLLDLGLARINDTDTTRELTGSGKTFGTPDYMAPEQWEDSHKVDARADLYALGCTLFFLLTGKPPYAEAESFAAKLMAHISGPIPDLTSACPAAPPELIAIYRKLMAKWPAERIASAWELVSLLTPLANERTDQVLPSQSNEGAEDARLLVNIDRGQSPKIARKKAPSFWIVGATLVSGAVAVAAIFGVVMTVANNAGKKTLKTIPNKPVSSDKERPETKASIELPPIDYAAERKAAQWLVDRMSGGFIKIEVGSGEWKNIDQADRKLPEENFALRQIQRIPELDDEGLALLAKCRRITFVTLAPNPRVSLTGVQGLTDSAAPTLDTLNLETSHEIQDEIVSLLSRKPFPALRQISASDMQAGSAWEDCPRLPSLEILDLPGAPLSNQGLQTICDRYPKLQKLGIPYGVNSSITDLGPLAGLKELQRLVSGSHQWSDANIAVLKDLPQFQSLVASSPVAKPPGSLQKLAPLADKLVEFELDVLAVWDPGPSDADYETVLRFRRLELLKLRGHTGSPSDDHLAKIAKLPALKKFHIHFDEKNRRYTADGVAAFRKARPEVELEVDGQGYPTPTK